MTDLTVKYFNSGMTGAPQISNNWGDLVTMLDACLINGFALKAIDTLTCTGGIATATISTGQANIEWLAYSPDGTRIVSTHERGDVVLWDAVQLSRLRTLPGRLRVTTT